MLTAASPIWASDEVSIKNTNRCFMYHYVIVKDGEIKQLENGAKRIADLDSLPD
jgi:hypothetical protein